MQAPLEVDVTTAAIMRRNGAVLLDVREAFEVEICAIADSRHIPMEQIPANLAALPSSQTILVICHYGVRSGRVTRFLRANGFPLATNVAGGIDAWADQVDRSLTKY